MPSVNSENKINIDVPLETEGKESQKDGNEIVNAVINEDESRNKTLNLKSVTNKNDLTSAVSTGEYGDPNAKRCHTAEGRTRFFKLRYNQCVD